MRDANDGVHGIDADADDEWDGRAMLARPHWFNTVDENSKFANGHADAVDAIARVVAGARN